MKTFFEKFLMLYNWLPFVEIRKDVYLAPDKIKIYRY
ncbi:hypothetical protein BH20BAC1_BH20BAC1_11040 [soil metagenome]